MTDTDLVNPNKENIVSARLDNQGSIQDTYYKHENSPNIGEHASDQFMSKVNFSMMKK